MELKDALYQNQKNYVDKYIMTHYNRDHWQIVCEKLSPLTQCEVAFERIIELISFFANDQVFQTRHNRDHKEAPLVFMLDRFFASLTEEQQKVYQKEILPGIVNLILEADVLFPLDQPIPLLLQEKSGRVTLTRRQCACLVAHMFFCLVTDQDERYKFSSLIDFSIMFQKPSLECNVNLKIEKLKCIFDYFQIVIGDNPPGLVTFERFCLDNPTKSNDWENCEKPVTKTEFVLSGRIEDATDSLQVVFTESLLGERVLSLPPTQQQVMSLIHPELMISLLFCEELKESEVIKVYGAMRYSETTGYLSSFKYVGRKQEEGDEERQHVLMNAQMFSSNQVLSQFSQVCVLAEINKAYAGFFHDNGAHVMRSVASGRWGCGVSRGNSQLKWIIQWLAASMTERELLFYPCDDVNFDLIEVEKIVNYYIGKKVSELYQDLVEANSKILFGGNEMKDLFKLLILHKNL